mmetsp:Transcript_8747/g.14557  ORF Transcript_8747/g.14557 Transcript_8747/m.14557 type:complete len:280 (+) Transcript_8747:87-926(+)|eukprot:CAMPEP_0171485342 /NCGR_PEP_ID=MMETSP0958-20121227/487_1 /TAXON_ID=87120 /ORGANISM="Aurantiochytrium limacinum, Strain ATCCMYA-1381" /LENGTH=279 /DNA_ID=CAMNT_0012018111 /DNA_START=27 /DNA_END=866 /DNA_ORIENTATION=-
MKVTLAVDNTEQVIQTELDSNSLVEDLKAIASVELGLPPDSIELSYDGEVLPDEAKLSDVGVSNEDLMSLRVLPPTPRTPRNSLQSRSSSGQRRSGSGFGFLRRSLSRPSRQEMYEQALIEQQITQRLVNENMQLALEESPEAFATVLMLYLDTEVNGVPVKAFVDSGAQTTVMSRSCAERCGIIRLVDTRFSGVAVGVGQARILGRVHIAPIKIGSQLYNCSFTVVDIDKMELLLGLDMLKKHQAMVDLRNDCLHIGDPEELVPFLSEAEVPENARLH